MPPEPGRNELEEPAYRLYPDLLSFSNQLRKIGSFHMSGSGGVHFAVFQSEGEARETQDRIASYCRATYVVPTRAGTVIREAAPCP